MLLSLHRDGKKGGIEKLHQSTSECELILHETYTNGGCWIYRALSFTDTAIFSGMVARFILHGHWSDWTGDLQTYILLNSSVFNCLFIVLLFYYYYLYIYFYICALGDQVVNMCVTVAVLSLCLQLIMRPDYLPKEYIPRMTEWLSVHGYHMGAWGSKPVWALCALPHAHIKKIISSLLQLMFFGSLCLSFCQHEWILTVFIWQCALVFVCAAPLVLDCRMGNINLI